ncbi:MAG: M28 family peptidase [Bacteroidia bacterium]
MKNRFFIKILIFVLFATTITALYSQGIGKSVYLYGKKVVATLAAPNMHGRGYVNGGDSIAAEYIKQEFTGFALKSFNDDYYQSFNFPINTYPAAISFNCLFDKGVKFKGIAAQNYLVYPSSPSINGSFETIVFDSTYTSSDKKFEKFRKKIKSKNVFVIVDDRNVTNKLKQEYFKKVKQGYFKANTIELVKKLTWTMSQDVAEYVRIKVLADSFSFSTKGYADVVIENKFIKSHKTQNIVGYVEGTEHPDSFIVFSAHYDHLGQMGKDVYFPGANDNASGCAMLLNLANYYAMPHNKPKYSIAFIAFAGEEVGLLGSKYYTENPLFPLKKIAFLLNTDIMGTGEDGITVVNGSVFKKEFDDLVAINEKKQLLKEIKIRGKAANSDHYHFSEKGVKAFFIYTMGGTKAYHDIYDRPETLPLNEFDNVFSLITNFIDSLQR